MDTTEANQVFGLFQFIVFVSYIISTIVTAIVYGIRRNHIADHDVAGITHLNNSFRPAWIVIGILGALLFISLWIACFTGDGVSCFIAVIWTLFSR